MEEELGLKLRLMVLDTQEGVEVMIKLWKAWQEIQYNLGQEREDEDRELAWGMGNTNDESCCVEGVFLCFAIGLCCVFVWLGVSSQI